MPSDPPVILWFSSVGELVGEFVGELVGELVSKLVGELVGELVQRNLKLAHCESASH